MKKSHKTKSSLVPVISAPLPQPENKIQEEQLKQVTGGKANATRGNSTHGRIHA
ncbi:MAG: hypothetical protein K0S11_262 [Gammaproteobacteria bacterium]|jgi:hypothetical protein|nr:hypothetical protein [Gammaproteobacteria bacterium]